MSGIRLLNSAIQHIGGRRGSGISVSGSAWLDAALAVTRNSVAYLDDGSQVTANVARTKTGERFTNAPSIKLGTVTARELMDCDPWAGWVLSTNTVNVLYRSTPAAWDSDESSAYTTVHTFGSGKVTAVTVISAGVWLACLNVDAAATNQASEIWRTTDYGANWTKVLTMTNGYVPPWSAFGVSSNGASVVIGEYGTAQVADNTGKGRIYYSADAGVTWTKIYDPIGDPITDPQKGLHTHAAIFQDGHEDIIWVSQGDFAAGNSVYLDQCVIYKLVYNTDTHVWDRTVVQQYSENPTCLVADGNYIYLTQDASDEFTISRIDVTTGIKTKCTDWLNVAVSGASPLFSQNASVGSFGFRKLDGTFYACFNAVTPFKTGGLTVSVDGVNWQMIKREVLTSTYATPGWANVAAHTCGGCVWASYRDTATGAYTINRVVTIGRAVATFTLLERGITNQFSAAASSFETAKSNMFATSTLRLDVPNSGRTLASSIGQTAWSGTYIYRMKGLGAGGSGNSFQMTSAGLIDPAVMPQVNDYITFSCRIKAVTASDRRVSVKAYLVGTSSKVTNSNNAICIPNQDWQTIVVTGQCNASMSVADRVSIYFDVISNGIAQGTAYTLSDGEWGAVDLYIDGFQMVYSADKPSPLSWQIGATARVDEYGTATLINLGNSYRVAFDVEPVVSRWGWFADFPIATLKNAGGDYVYLSYSYSDSKFKITDGTDSALSAAVANWHMGDVFKIQLRSDGADTIASIWTSADGQLADFTLSGSFVAVPTSLVINANSDASVLGAGWFGPVQYRQG